MRAIHGWPEEARQLFAVVVMVVAVFAVFSGWNSIVSSSLTPLSGTVVAVSSPAGLSVRGTQIGSETSPLVSAPPNPPNTGESTTVLSPLGGIVESLKGIATLVAKFPSPRESVESVVNALRAFDLKGGANQTLDALGQFLYGITR